jgi:hypothetical protein
MGRQCIGRIAEAGAQVAVADAAPPQHGQVRDDAGGSTRPTVAGT